MTQGQLDEIKARADSVTTLRRARRLPAIRLSDDASTLIAEVERLRARLTVTPDMVERAARALANLEPGEDWPSNRLLGGSLCGTRDDEYRSAMYEQAQEALDAALGTQEEA